MDQEIQKKIPNDLLHGNTFVLGAIFRSGCFIPKPAIYRYKYPPTLNLDADDRVDKKPNYALQPNEKPMEPLMSIPMLMEQGEAAGMKILEVDYHTKFAILVTT